MPEETLAVLRRRAAQSHQSLQEYMLGRVIGEAQRPTRELLATVRPYDAAHVALAEARGMPLLTADVRLARAPGPRCDFRLVED